VNYTDLVWRLTNAQDIIFKKKLQLLEVKKRDGISAIFSTEPGKKRICSLYTKYSDLHILDDKKMHLQRSSSDLHEAEMHFFNAPSALEGNSQIFKDFLPVHLVHLRNASQPVMD